LLVWYLIAVTYKSVTVCKELTGREIGKCGKKPQDNEGVSPNESEPCLASLHYIAVVSLPEKVKPITSWEVTSECTNWTAWGDRGGRVPRARLPTGRVANGTWEIPLVIEGSRISP